jgi:hypothetical protein
MGDRLAPESVIGMRRYPHFASSRPFCRSRRHPEIRPADRAFWILRGMSWSQWAETLAILRPDTIVR